MILCHDLLRRSPRLTICSPLFFKVQSFIIMIALPLPLTFLRFNFFTIQFLRFSFYVSFFYESFLRSIFFYESFLRVEHHVWNNACIQALFHALHVVRDTRDTIKNILSFLFCSTFLRIIFTINFFTNSFYDPTFPVSRIERRDLRPIRY